MLQLVEFPLDGGGTVVVEVAAAPPAAERGPTRGFRATGELAVSAKETFQEAFSRIQPAADAMISRLRDVADPPDEVEIEFGVQLTAEFGAVVAKASGDANFRVLMRWRAREKGRRVSDFDELRIRIEHGIGETYRVSASCDAGDYSGTFALPFDGRDLELFLLRLGGRGRAGTRRVESSEKQLITEFGGKLFGAVFAGPVGVAYRLARNEAERSGKSLRVTLALSGAPELMKLPWEYLYDDPEFLAISSWTPVVRYLDMPGAFEPLKVELPLRILAMVSSPEDAVALDVQRERENLEQALAGLIARDAVEITWLEDATLEALLRILQGGPFHVFHYIGHGAYDAQSRDGVLLLEDSRNRARQVTGRDLGIYLGEHRTLRLAVLNACEGARAADDDPFAGVATSLVQRKIPAVIAMQFEITDSAAITFAGEFYWKLADCGTVDTALAFARQAIYASNEIEWATPVLFLRVHDGRIFDVPEATVGHPEPAVPAQPTPAEQDLTPPAPSPAPSVAGGPATGAAVAKRSAYQGDRRRDNSRRGSGARARGLDLRAVEQHVHHDDTASVDGDADGHRAMDARRSPARRRAQSVSVERATQGAGRARPEGRERAGTLCEELCL